MARASKRRNRQMQSADPDHEGIWRKGLQHRPPKSLQRAGRLHIAERMRAKLKQRIDAGESVYALAQGAGVPEGALGRFVKGAGDMSLKNAERVLAHLGFQLKPPPKPRTPAPPTPQSDDAYCGVSY